MEEAKDVVGSDDALAAGPIDPPLLVAPVAVGRSAAVPGLALEEPDVRAFARGGDSGDELPVDMSAPARARDGCAPVAGASPLLLLDSQSLRRSLCRSMNPIVTVATASANVTTRRQRSDSASVPPSTLRHAPHCAQRGANPLVGDPQRRHRTMGIGLT